MKIVSVRHLGIARLIEKNEASRLDQRPVSKLRVIEMRRQRLAAAKDRDIALDTASRAGAQMASVGSGGQRSRAEARVRILADLARAEAEAKNYDDRCVIRVLGLANYPLAWNIHQMNSLEFRGYRTCHRKSCHRKSERRPQHHRKSEDVEIAAQV